MTNYVFRKTGDRLYQNFQNGQLLPWTIRPQGQDNTEDEAYEIARGLEDEFGIDVYNDDMDPDFPEKVARQLDGKKVEVTNNGQTLFTSTISARGDNPMADVYISFDTATNLAQNHEGDELVSELFRPQRFQEVVDQYRAYDRADDPREDDWNNFGELLGHAELTSLTIRPVEEEPIETPEEKTDNQEDTGQDENQKDRTEELMTIAILVLAGLWFLKR